MRIGIFGAGAIGSFLGVRLSASGTSVRLVAREDVVDARGRLVAIDRDGRRSVPSTLDASTDPSVLEGCDAVLVTVKSQDTLRAAEALSSLPASAVVVSFQNGLDNPARIRERVRCPVVRGIVTYNVFRDAPHRTRQATRGKLIVGDDRVAGSVLRALVEALERAGEDVALVPDAEGLALGKLLINLNNGVCAATGLPIQASLRDRDARTVFGLCIREGLEALRAAGLRPVSPLPLPLSLIARLLRLPDAVVLRVARGLVDVHPDARSSTLQDLDRGRATEIDELNGAIVGLGRRHGVRVPANGVVVDVIHGLEASIARGEPPAFVAPAELRARIVG